MMNRRGFLSSLFKAAIGVAVAPSVIAEVASLEASKKVIVYNHNGHEYWIDWAQWKAEKEWMEQQEALYWSMRYRGKDVQQY